MSAIRPINRQSVHQICSGQVILDLATAVKELVENSLDAGASAIEIKLKDYGITAIEVGDNGGGIEEANYEGLTKKHHTSKLQDFSDLASVETFGFRGEALSSLCALSNLTVTTRFSTSKSGHRLEYDHDGKIVKKTCIARQPGTSVVLKNIFVPLPVRHVEFEKNIKREYSKLLNLMYSYCVICTEVQISCSNEIKGNKREVFRTSGSKSTQDSIVTLFGSKLFKSLILFEQTLPTEESCENYRINLAECLNFSKDCIISGYISSCGSGRRANDMQYISVNKRPCHLPKFSKLINEIFRLFNKNQYPFIQLDISMKRDQVDVNVTPDKRQVFLTHEKALLAILKSCMLKMYDGMNRKIDTISPQASKLTNSKCNGNRNLRDMFGVVSKSISKCARVVDICGSINTEKSTSTDNQHGEHAFQSALEDLESSIRVDKTGSFSSPDDAKSTPNFSPLSMSNFMTQNREKQDSVQVSQQMEIESQSFDDTFNSGTPASTFETSSVSFSPIDPSIPSESTCFTPTTEPKSLHILEETAKSPSNTFGNVTSVDLKSSDTLSCQSKKSRINDEFSLPCVMKYDGNEDSLRNSTKSSYKLMFSSQKFYEKWKLKEELRNFNDQADTVTDGTFNAKILSSENDKAEKELSKQFDRASFKNMEIIGQFNLGFIIARYSKDLFIIDQHASDEKYNYEVLRKTTKLNGQPLILPQKLELTASDIMVLEENMEVFVHNGFGFDIRTSDVGMKSVFLLKVPTSKNLVFDASDVAELIFILRDHPHILCRPSRIQQMLASRACRKSIMIGSPLTNDAMKHVVNHMSEMDQPWNCPHGRPTMRHLIDLSMIDKND